MPGTISFGGLSTGIDTKSIISQLMVLERRPETLLKNQKTALQAKVDVFTKLNTALKSLQTLASGMNTEATFAAKSVTVSDNTLLTVQTTGAAVTGAHSLVVNTMATSQRQVSATGFASKTDANFNTGTFTVTDDKGGTPVTITIGAGDNSLNGIAAAINNSGGGFTASVINDGTPGTPYRLMVNGKDTKNYTFDFSGLTTPPTAPNGAAYANPSFVQSGATYVAGADASFTLDGISMTRSSNTVGDALPGITLNLLKGGGATSSFTVSNDTAGVTAKINSFITSYNDAVKIISEQSTYDSMNQSAGILSGDSTVRGLQASLQMILSSPVEGSNGTYTLASQVGIKTQKDGTLTLDSAKLSAALGADFNGVVDFFTHNSNTAGLPSTQYGLAEQFNQKLNLITKPYISQFYSGNGILATRIQSLKDRMISIDSRIAQMEVLMARKEENLNKQYSAMETLVSSLQTMGSQITSAMNAMTNSKN